MASQHGSVPGAFGSAAARDSGADVSSFVPCRRGEVVAVLGRDTREAEGGSNARTHVTLALSEDGDRFDRHYVIGDDAQGAPRLEGHLKHGRYGYPFLHVRGERALVAWSVNKEDIAVASFALPRRG